MIYFDHNASSPMMEEAKEAWLEGAENFIGNPSSPHRIGSRADNALTEAREKIARIIGCDAADIIFTSGATESNNSAILHFASTVSEQSAAWISATEHPSVIESARAAFGTRVQWIPTDESGVVDFNWIEERLKTTRPALVAVMAANNETGVLQPWQKLSEFCRHNGIPFLCDATQWIGRLPSIELGKCDYVTASAHKVGGPKGIGFLKVPSKGKFRPLFRGGRQEDNRRAGTENVPGAVAMAGALEKCEGLFQTKAHDQRLEIKNVFESCLVRKLPGTQIIAGTVSRLWNTTSVLMPSIGDCGAQQRWVVKLDKAGFAVSTGSACASGREEPSHVLRAMKFSPDEASRALRFSGGWNTTESDWTHLLEALHAIYTKTKHAP